MTSIWQSHTQTLCFCSNVFVTVLVVVTFVCAQRSAAAAAARMDGNDDVGFCGLP